MVVGGTRRRDPTLGILDAGRSRRGPARLRRLEPGRSQAVLPALAAFVTRAGLTPTTCRPARGELKYLLVTESPDGELMVRFVLRSQEPVARIRKHLPVAAGRAAAARGRVGQPPARAQGGAGGRAGDRR